MIGLRKETDMKRRVARFNEIIVDSAHKHIGKTKPRRGGKSYLTPSVKAAITKRNKLRKLVQERKEEGWKHANK